MHVCFQHCSLMKGMSEDQVKNINFEFGYSEGDSPVRSSLVETAPCYLGMAHTHSSPVVLLH